MRTEGWQDIKTMLLDSPGLMSKWDKIEHSSESLKEVFHSLLKEIDRGFYGTEKRNYI
jgi:hypothetical protein